MRKAHHVAAAILAVLLGVSLSACAAAGTPLSADAVSAPGAPSASEQIEQPVAPAVPFRLCRWETEDGLYTLQSFAAGYCNILYTNYATRQQSYLCESPNCTHDTSACTSYVPLADDQVPPMILTTDENILLVYGAASSQGNAKIMIADKNGNSQQLLVELEDGETISGGLYQAGDWLYYEAWSVNNTAGGAINRSRVQKTNLTTAETVSVFTLPDWAAISGISGTEYVVDKFDSTTNQIEKFFLHPQEQEAYLDETPFVQAGADQCGIFVLNGKLVTYTYKSASLEIEDLQSKQKQVIDCSAYVPPYNEELKPDISALYGGCVTTDYLKLTTTTKKNDSVYTEYRIVNLVDGTISDEIEWEDSHGNEMLPVGNWDDFFCVITGYQEYATSFQGEDGSTQAGTAAMPVYALIAKENYFSENQELLPIQSVVFPENAPA